MKMNNYFTTLFFAGLVAMSITGCDDDNNNTAPTPIAITPGDDDKIGPVYQDQLSAMKQTFTLDADGGEIEGEDGTVVSFYANSFFKSNGDPVTGDVTIELVEIYKKSQMLLTNMTTQGIDASGNIAMLVSGGEFFVNAKQGDEQLVLNGTFQIAAPVDNTGGLDQGMKPFIGAEQCEEGVCKNVWRQQDRDMKMGESTYNIFQNQFGWTNIDRWYSDPRPKTTLFVDVPEGYDNTNCSVYLSYDGEPTALASFDRYDSATGLFTEHYGQVPIGLEVHFIMVSVIDDQWYYAIKGATIGAEHVETFTELQPITEAALVTLIDDLP
jgi:hypothetical protein